MKLNQFAVLSVFLGAIALTGCGDNQPANVSAENHIKVGVIAGSEYEVAEFVQKQAKELYDLDVELITFNDYVIPNEALNKGDIDVNAFQHRPFLEEQMKDRGYQLAVVGNTFVYPIAAYSRKVKSVDEIKDGATIAIPNDPTNLGRALLLLQHQGFIKVDPKAGLLPTALDIIDNPRNFNILELEAPQLPRTLDDPKIDLAIINTAYSSQIDLTPAKDGIFVEDKESPYVNTIVARENNKDSEKVKKFVKAYQTEAVNQKANEVFNGGAVKGW